MLMWLDFDGPAAKIATLYAQQQAVYSGNFRIKKKKKISKYKTKLIQHSQTEKKEDFLTIKKCV
jgi:hypothetical protein